MILASALGHELRLGGQMLAVIGLLYVVLGNVMGKLRQNYTVGIRTPWTLADERVWDQTHRFGGRIMVAGGFALLVCAFLPALHGMQVALVLAIAVAITLAVGAKSYLLWRARDANKP